MEKFTSCYLERKRWKVSVGLVLGGHLYHEQQASFDLAKPDLVCRSVGWVGSMCRVTWETWAEEGPLLPNIQR